MSITYTVMIVIGGMGSITGAALGAAVVIALPQLLDHYSQVLPFIADTDTQSAFGPTYVGNMLYAVLVVVILIFQPLGLSGVASAVRNRIRSLARRRAPSKTAG